jgi:zinc protease
MFGRLMVLGAAVSGFGMASPLLADGAEENRIVPVIAAPRIDYTLWKLANGLTVIALPDDTTADVTTSLWYKVGSKHDPEGRAGFSHLFEHILSRKTMNMPYNMINRLTEDVGGQRNASNWIDRTNYYETVPAQYLETMLWTHRERMAFPVVDGEVFERERTVVKEELRQRVLAPPYGRLQRFVIAENAYDVLPMRRPGIGSIEELDAATLEDARAFHQAYYGPDTAILIVAGNFEVPWLRKLVDRYFADIPRRTNPVSLEISTIEPPREEVRSIAVTAPNVPLPVVGNIWKGPRTTHPDAAPLAVLSAILSGGDNSRLHRSLVRTGKALNVVHSDALSMNGGHIASYAVLSPSADREEVVTALDAEINALRWELVSAAELTGAKNELLAAALSARQTVRGRAFALGEALVSTGDPDAADLRLQQIAAVTAEDVRRVAAAWLPAETAVSFTYEAGDDDPASYANPFPRPDYGFVPPATGVPLELLPEGERQEPPDPSAAPAVRRAEVVQTRLTNDIPLVTAQTSDVPIATVTIVFPGGNASDAPGKAGVASMAARLANKGTPTHDAEVIAARLESLGAFLGATTNDDGTFISLTAPTVNLEAAGAVLVDVVRNASYPPEELELERKRSLDGLNANLKDPATIASLVARRVLYGEAPYGMVPNERSLPRINQDDLIAHRSSWWHPAKARIVISGGIDPQQARAFADDLVGDWTSSLPPSPAPTNPAGIATPVRTIVIDLPGAGQAAVVAGVRTLARSAADFYPLWLANTVLGAGSNGRLFEEVRTRRGLSYGAYSTLGQSLDAALLTASAQTRNDAAAEVAGVFLDEFQRLGDEPLDFENFQRRRLFLSGTVTRNLETSAGFNSQVASLMLRGLEPAEAFLIAERLEGIAPEAAVAAAQSYVVPDRASLVIVGDAAQFIDSLRDLRGDVEVIPITELDLGSPDLRRGRWR